MEDIVPLYYDMMKAPSVQVNKDEIYNGLKLAYTGGNIGIYSNDISKIWNSDNVNLEVIKLLCCENNFVIDYAKTLYKPERPSKINKVIRNYTKAKVPHFFIYAKDKEEDKVEPANKSVVNRLESIIPNKMLKFKAKNLGRFDYRKLYSNYNFTYGKDSQEIIDKYIELDRNKFNYDSEQDIDNDVHQQNRYVFEYIRDELLKVNSDVYYVVDVLVKHLYETKKSSRKETLWNAFGDVIVNNLNNSIEEKVGSDVVLCERCGERVEYSSKHDGATKYCDSCRHQVKKEQKRIEMKKYREKLKMCRG